MRPIYSIITTHKFLGELSAASGAKLYLREKPVPTRKKNSTQLISHDDGSETASDADRPAGRSLRKTPSSE